MEAEIHAKDVTISGRMVGNIKALDRVKLTKEAEFKGEVQAKRISVEDGAYVKSVIELDRDDSNLDKSDANKVVSTGKPDFRPPASKTPKKEPDNLTGSADKG